jgi:hypothetical protein
MFIPGELYETKNILRFCFSEKRKRLGFPVPENRQLMYINSEVSKYETYPRFLYENEIITIFSFSYLDFSLIS